ncbi:MAG TPA: ornithine carbamoyltransferase [Myxococcota bacterium]|nr:ornithine carbamoyltransferase [Myxococcales bacterium]HPG28888.1 ornithine carbamoyltransferase [Myxococcota bacterium]
MPKDFLTVADWPADELWALVERGLALREAHRSGHRPRTLEGRTLAMYFEKPSLRTHVTFEAGIAQLGGHAILLRPEQIGIGTRETPQDVARALSRWVDCLMARTFSHELVEQLARDATIPVINGLTDLYHPCQAMADLVTVAGVMKPQDATLAYVGDGNNVAHSLILLSAVLGLRLRIATPASHPPAARVMARARGLAAASGAEIELHEDPFLAVEGVNFVYTDVWTSMGQEAEAEQRRRIFRPYQVNADLMSRTANAWLLHCLPAHRGEEVTDDVLEGPRSLVFDQAENRLHAQNAILERLLAAG